MNNNNRGSPGRCELVRVSSLNSSSLSDGAIGLHILGESLPLVLAENGHPFQNCKCYGQYQFPNGCANFAILTYTDTEVVSEAPTSAHFSTLPCTDRFYCWSCVQKYRLDVKRNVDTLDNSDDLRVTSARRHQQCESESQSKALDSTFIACEEGDWDRVTEFISKYHDSEEDNLSTLVMMRNKNKCSLAYTACFFGFLQITQYLLDKGAAVDESEGFCCRSLFMAACINNHFAIVQFLKGYFNIHLDRADADGKTAFIWACANGNMAIVKYLHEIGADPYLKDKMSRTCFHWAVMNGHLHVVEYLFESGITAKVNTAEDSERIPWLLACFSGHTSVVEFFCKTEALTTDIVAVDKCGRTGISLACEEGHLAVVAYLLQIPSIWSQIDQVDEDLFTPLMWACFKGRCTTVQLLCAHGANINLVDADGKSAFIWACVGGDKSTVEFLHTISTDLPCRSDIKKRSPIYWACAEGQLEVVTFLRKLGANINQAGVDGKTPFMAACAKGQLAIAQFIHDNGDLIDINETDLDGSTAAIWACYGDHVEILQALHSWGADLMLTNSRYGLRPMHYACFQNCLRSVKYLVQAGIDINCTDHERRTGILFAARHKFLPVFQFLFESGANLDIPDLNGKLPLTHVFEKGSLDIFQYLCDKGVDMRSSKLDRSPLLEKACNSQNVIAVKSLLTLNADVNVECGTKLPLDIVCELNDLTLVEVIINEAKSITTRSLTSSLFVACMKSSIDLCKYLYEHGADINALNADGVSPLHVAAKVGSLELIRYLASIVRDINILDLKGNNALAVASGSGRFDIIHFLVAAGCRVNLGNIEGRHPLHFACDAGDREMVMVLIDLGHEINVVDCEGATPIFLASAKGFHDICVLLHQCGSYVNIGVSTKQETPLMLAAIRNDHRHFQWLLELATDINRVNSDMDTIVHILCTRRQIDLMLSVLNCGVEIDLLFKNAAGKTALECLIGAKEDLIESLLQTEMQLSAFAQCHHYFWFFVIQLEDSPELLAELIARYLINYPVLSVARDKNNRSVLDVATRKNRQVVIALSQWHGRYRLLDRQPEHMSATCLVYRAYDDLNCDKNGNPRPVALKLMVNRANFVNEFEMRKSFEDDFVVNIIAGFPSISDFNFASDNWPDFVDLDLSKIARDVVNGVCSRDIIEKMYCIVMPLADRNLWTCLKQERWTGLVNVSKVQLVFRNLVNCVQHIHRKGVLHADLKTLNIVRVNGDYRLIDFDASCELGQPIVASKYSTAYIPPEAIFIDPRTQIPVIKYAASGDHSHTIPVLVAETPFDIWSLGCILYQMCSDDISPLFKAGQDDDLSGSLRDDDSLHSLCDWSYELKEKKLSKISNLIARNLVSQMLSKDPYQRPSISRILSHPFLSGNKAPRLVGDEPQYDVFISYRVKSDFAFVKDLYELLTQRQLHVWWDKVSLQPGEAWQDGFCNGLADSRTFVCLLSREGLSNFEKLLENSATDNVLLEHRLALELQRMGMIEKIFPLMIGDVVTVPGLPIEYNNFFAAGCTPKAPRIPVLSMESDLRDRMEKMALGSPFEENKPVSEVLSEILKHQGAQVEGLRSAAIDSAATQIIDMVEACKLAKTSKKTQSDVDLAQMVLSLQEHIKFCENKIDDLQSKLRGLGVGSPP